MYSKYIGHPMQLYGVQEKCIVGGKGNGMRMLEIRNGQGLEFSISLDRCADVVQVYVKGVGLAYISPCGLVSPKYFDKEGTGFLKSFTAGFLTTCGLTSAGSACVDDGEALPLHGTVSHIPAESFSYEITENEIIVKATIRDASLFSHQLFLKREYRCSLKENTISLCDTIENIGCKTAPYMIIYYCNMGYPLLSEETELNIPSSRVVPRDKRAEEGFDEWNKIFPPTDNFDEQCYFHSFNSNPEVSIYNPKVDVGMKMSFSIKELDCFTQWKMMGDYEYALGLEPGNCLPLGRDVARQNGTLKFLSAGEKQTNNIVFEFFSKK